MRNSLSNLMTSVCLSLLSLSLSAGILRTAAAQDLHVLTFHYDSARLGWNNRETQLTPGNVHPGSFGKLWHSRLDGGVPGSPLYVSGLDISGQPHDVVFAATDANSVYALDAASGNVLWSRPKLVEPLSEAQFLGSWFGFNKHGILSTPTIDLETSTLYTCTLRSKGLKQLYEVWALDIRTGATRPGWPVVLHGMYKGVKFVAGQVMQRGALSLVNDWLYVPFGGRYDTPPWRGWLFGVDTRHPEGPQRAFCSSPESDGGGIWSGGGVCADTAGDLYVATGNGDFDLLKGGSNLAESILRLSTTGSTFDFSRKSADYYTPGNYKFLDEQDEDLGGCTGLVLPDQPNARTPHLLFMCGKDGLAYVLNRDNLGGVGREILKTRLFGDPNATYHEGIRSTSAYLDAGDAGRFLFVAGDQPGPNGENNGMLALKLVSDAPDGGIHLQKIWTQKQPLNGPSSPVVSSNGATNAIVWVVETNDGEGSNLRAFDAMNGTEIFNSNQCPPADRFDNGKRFTSPIVVKGRVFVGASGVVCYGLKESK